MLEDYKHQITTTNGMSEVSSSPFASAAGSGVSDALVSVVTVVTEVSAARDLVGVAGGGTGPELPLGGSDGASDPNKHHSKSPESVW